MFSVTEFICFPFMNHRMTFKWLFRKRKKKDQLLLLNPIIIFQNAAGPKTNKTSPNHPLQFSVSGMNPSKHSFLLGLGAHFKAKVGWGRHATEKSLCNAKHAREILIYLHALFGRNQVKQFPIKGFCKVCLVV